MGVSGKLGCAALQVGVLILTLTFLEVVDGAVGAGEASYSEFGFPDPRLDYQACGQQQTSYICDPSSRLSLDEVSRLDNIIDSLKSSDTCLCDDDDDCSRSSHHEIMVAIVPRIKYVTGRFPETYEAQKKAARVFAEHLRDTQWKTVVKCSMHAYIVLDLHTNIVWTATDYYAYKVISDDRATEVGLAAKNKDFKHGSVFAGLEMMLVKYKDFLVAGIPGKTFAWWEILLIVLGSIGGFALLVAGCCCCIQGKCGDGSGRGGSSGGGVWGGSHWGGGGGGCGGGGGGTGGGGCGGGGGG